MILDLRDIFANEKEYIDKEVTVQGWIRKNLVLLISVMVQLSHIYKLFMIIS